MTEKVFKVMNNIIVPVVYNNVNMTQFLPPKSYVNINDFDKLESLAKHLKFLTENPREYVKYFWWKSLYSIT